MSHPYLYSFHHISTSSNPKSKIQNQQSSFGNFSPLHPISNLQSPIPKLFSSSSHSLPLTSRAALEVALQTYKNTQTSQAGAIGQSSGTRIDRDSHVEQATERRLWLQFAADAEWTYTDPANTPIRRQFQLPANRAFIG